MPEPTSILDVLLTESHPDAGVKAQEELEAAGVRVHRCHEPGSDGFPCSALAGPGCPLEEGVDAVVVVRKNAATHPTALEGGVTCGLRAGSTRRGSSHAPASSIAAASHVPIPSTRTAPDADASTPARSVVSAVRHQAGRRRRCASTRAPHSGSSSRTGPVAT